MFSSVNTFFSFKQENEKESKGKEGRKEGRKEGIGQFAIRAHINIMFLNVTLLKSFIVG